MSVANLTKYDIGCSERDIGDFRMVPVANGEYVKFEEAMEASSNSVQQLKAEIAALVEEHSHGSKFCGGNYHLLVTKLRQLSAV
jgi:hypothetical protein